MILKIKKNLNWVSLLPENKIIFCNLNIFDKNSIDLAISKTSSKFGSIDACINLAYPKNKSWGKSFEDLTINELSENLMFQMGGAIILSQRIMKFF